MNYSGNNFDINILSNRQENNLISVADSVINNKSIKITKPNETGFYLMNFEKFDLLFYGVENKKSCRFFDFFELNDVNKIEDDIRRIFSFNKLGVKHLLEIKNFKVENIFEIHKRVYIQQPFDGIELLLLKMLNYCDYLDNGDNASLSLSACLNFANWSCSTRKQEDSSYVDQLNILQVKYRLGSLSADENKILIEVIESNISRNDEKFAASVLLRNTTLADKYFDLISEDIKEKIIKYPIYTLYKELK